MKGTTGHRAKKWRREVRTLDADTQGGRGERRRRPRTARGPTSGEKTEASERGQSSRSAGEQAGRAAPPGSAFLPPRCRRPGGRGDGTAVRGGSSCRAGGRWPQGHVRDRRGSGARPEHPAERPLQFCLHILKCGPLGDRERNPHPPHA